MTLEIKLEEIPQLEEPSYEQKKWALRKLKKGSKSWERWDDTIEEWQPYSNIDRGKFINIWRCYKK